MPYDPLILKCSQPVRFLILNISEPIYPLMDDLECIWLLLPRPLELKGCPVASVSVSIGAPSSWSPSSSLLGRRTLILVMVKVLMVEGVGIRLIS